MLAEQIAKMSFLWQFLVQFRDEKTARRSQQLQGPIRSLAVMVRKRRSETHLF